MAVLCIRGTRKTYCLLQRRGQAGGPGMLCGCVWGCGYVAGGGAILSLGFGFCGVWKSQQGTGNRK